MRLGGTLAVLVTGLALVAAADATRQRRQPAHETCRSARVGANGTLAIVGADGRTVTVPKAADQTTFDGVAVADDHTAVGAQAMYAIAATSYDIPLALVVDAGGRVHRFRGDLPIFQWAFAAGGRQVAYSQETVHFACRIHYELRDVASERLVDAVDVPEPCGPDPAPALPMLPAWVATLRAHRP